MDLDDWLARRRDWREFIELVDQMPPGCRWKSAQAHDRQLAEELLAQLGPEGLQPPTPEPPRFEGWTAERQDLADIKDMLYVLIAVAARSPRKPGSVDRPEPAIDAILAERSSHKLDSLVSTLLGGG